MLHTITLCFTKPSIIRRALENYYSTTVLPTNHILLHAHYPIGENIKTELEQLAKDFKCTLMDAGSNLGLHHGFNWVLGHIKPQPGDVIIGYDHDSCPVNKGWDAAMMKVLGVDTKHVWASLRTIHTLDELKTITLNKVDGVYYFKPEKPVMNSVCAFKWEFLERTGGLRENSNFYGHLEAPMWALTKEYGVDWCFLLDYYEHSELLHEHDEQYKLYKWAHAHEQTHDGDFASYLSKNKPL